MRFDTDELMEKAKQAASDAGKAAARLADSAGEKTGEVIDRAKIRYRIFELRGRSAELRKKVGTIVFEAHRGGSARQEELDDLLFELDAVQDELETMKARWAAGRTVCPGCGKKCSAASRYCPSCGREL